MFAIKMHTVVQITLLVTFGVLLINTPAKTQTIAGLAEFAGFLQNVAYPGLQELLGEQQNWSAFGYNCIYTREGGFHSWQWKWTGKINCDGLGVWERTQCKSRGCAFKEPMKGYLTELARRGVATKEQLVQQILNCNCGFNSGDVNEMIIAINAA